MANKEEKSRWRKNRPRVARLLREEWDPIGVGAHLPEDEYDAYVDRIYGMIVQENRSIADLIECLREIELKYFGLSDTPGASANRKRVAESLINFRDEF